MEEVYDLIIIGAGMAGMTASIYASRYKMSHLIFGETPGGQGILAGSIENYPGFLSIPGPELMQKVMEQVQHYEVQINAERVVSIVKTANGFEVKTEQQSYQAKTLVIVAGASSRQLNVPGEDKFLGKGVSYCVNCDGPLYKEKIVAIIGGGDSAITGAIHVAAFAKKVYLIHRRDEFRAKPGWLAQLEQNTKIEKILSTQITEIKGSQNVEEIVLDKPYQGNTNLKVDGVFIEIGQVPSSALVSNLGVELDEQSYVKVNPSMETNVAGVFAAGDIAAIQGGLIFRQLAASAADGARAAASAYHHLHQANPVPSWGKE